MFSNIFDSHAHYDDEKFNDDLYELLSSFKSNGVCGVINCAVNEETTRFGKTLSEKYDFIHFAAGFHPLNLEDFTDDGFLEITELAKAPKCVAIGEIGLDYYYEKETRNEQLKLFEAQLKLANSLNLPVIVHDREAHEDTLRLLKEYKPKGVVHCFSGSVEMAREVLKIGMYIGLGGAVTFKNAVKPVQVAEIVPSDRLLIETDAPYMTPVPFRGKRCTSLHIPYTAQRLAEIRGTDCQEILNMTSENAKKLFNI